VQVARTELVKVWLGGVVWPTEWSPQQVTLPSADKAQLCAFEGIFIEVPTARSTNTPAGGEPWPDVLSPQQARVPSLRIAQEKDMAAATATKLPLGGVLSPAVFSP
jgi:hypothetical protein